jgi:hypothetical protein
VRRRLHLWWTSGNVHWRRSEKKYANVQRRWNAYNFKYIDNLIETKLIIDSQYVLALKNVWKRQRLILLLTESLCFCCGKLLENWKVTALYIRMKQTQWSKTGVNIVPLNEIKSIFKWQNKKEYKKHTVMVLHWNRLKINTAIVMDGCRNKTFA